MINEIEENGGVFNTLLMKDEHGNPNVPAVIVVFALPVLTCISLCFIFMKSDNTHEILQDKSKKV
jgi:hypothetical protein